MGVSKFLGTIPITPRSAAFVSTWLIKGRYSELIEVPGRSPSMSTEIKKEIELEIAHVLFTDIVGYSKLPSISNER
jgi:hypothetical protein